MMSNDKVQTEPPVTCSKCNLVFESDADYLRHYNDKHKPAGKTSTDE
jgi:uncharacterized C2H2 Zn-finger protein